MASEKLSSYAPEEDVTPQADLDSEKEVTASPHKGDHARLTLKSVVLIGTVTLAMILNVGISFTCLRKAL